MKDQVWELLNNLTKARKFEQNNIWGTVEIYPNHVEMLKEYITKLEQQVQTKTEK